MDAFERIEKRQFEIKLDYTIEDLIRVSSHEFEEDTRKKKIFVEKRW